MSAEQEAIKAVLATGIPVHQGVIAEVLRSVPVNLLARVVAERYEAMIYHGPITDEDVAIAARVAEFVAQREPR